MDFTEIGVKSRKTGLTARENVKRDAHNMEDLDDFFKDDDRTLVGNGASTVTTKSSESVGSTSTNGRLIFDNVSRSSRTGSRKRTPLLSPLPSTEQLRSNITEREYSDAIEHQPPASSTADMDIDEETRGNIRAINVPGGDEMMDRDYDEVDHNTSQVIQQTPKPPRGQKLFVSSSDDDLMDKNHRNKSYQERQRELERNTTVRSAGRASSRGSASNYRQRTPPHVLETSPLKSLSHRLHSPLQPLPSAHRMANITKKIALNRKPMTSSSSIPPPLRTRPLPDYNSDQSADEDNYVDPLPIESDSDNEDMIRTKARGSRAKQPPRKAVAKKATLGKKAKAIRAPVVRKPRPLEDSDDDDDDGVLDDDSADDDYGNERGRGRSRTNKFQRRSESSARSKEHHIGVDRLRADQETRSSSKNGQSALVSRRSSRIRMPPLAFWRNEKPVYSRSKEDVAPVLQEVITVDEVVDAPRKSRAPSRAVSRSRGRSRARSKSRSRTSRPPSQSRRRNGALTEEGPEEDDEEERAVSNSEVAGSGWLKQGFLKVDAYEGHGSEEKSQRLVAWAPGTENFSSEVKTAEDNFKLAILFDKNREFIASGMMLIPPGGKKNMKSTDGTYFVFYCISGVIQVTLSGSVFMIKKGCSLEVPMGNFYEFVNKGSKDATLFFVQTKGQEVIDDDEF